MENMDLDIFEGFLRDLKVLQSFKEFQQFAEPSTLITDNQKTVPFQKASSKRKKRFNPLKGLKENEFHQRYRFSKENMRKIIEMVRDDLELESPGPILEEDKSKPNMEQVPVELQIMAAIRYWGHTESMTQTARLHQVKLKTLAKISRRVASALALKASRYIRMPVTFAEKEKVTKAFQELAGIPNIIGAVGHTAVAIVSQEQREENFASQILVQLVCDVSLKIRDIYCRLRPYEIEDYTSRMFVKSRIKERFQQNEFRGRVLVSETRPHGGLNVSYVLTPLERPTRQEEDEYNRSLAATLTPALNCLSQWEQRFGILSAEICASHKHAKQLVVALALLHNMAIEWGDLPKYKRESSRKAGDDLTEQGG